LSSATFFLRQHIFLCRDIRHWVILDVARDKYICVDREQFESLGPWLHGWEGMSESEARTGVVSPPPVNALELADELLSGEILSRHPEGTKEARATQLAPCTEELTVALGGPLGKWQWYHAPAFFLSAAAASHQLRYRPLRSIISYIDARKQRSRRLSHTFDFDYARTLVEAFYTLRPWYPRSYLCMFDSLALLHFMAWFGSFPEWVFGVTAEPFKAHCWVRAGNTVVNDTLERTGAFTPIMRV
jgi:hypothetical protein